MAESDQDVFDHFHSDFGNSSRAIALLAYAKYAQDKFDWMSQRTARAGTAPNEREIAKWIAELPNSRLAEIHAGATILFKEAAEAYLNARIQQERADAIEGSILGRVEAMAHRVEHATSFKAMWLPNLLVGIIASVAFALIVLIGAAIYRRDPSPFALFKEVSPPAQGGPVRPTQ